MTPAQATGTMPATCVPRVLAVSEYFLPGCQGGGVITAVANAIARLKPRITFDVLTSDRDLGASEAYPDVQRGVWNRTPYGNVFYAKPWQRQPLALRQAVHDVAYDVLYLNSFFSPLTFHFLTLRRLGLLREAPVVIAPRGELAPSALRVRRWKKVPYEQVVRLGLYDGVTWQASSDREAGEISNFFERRHGRKVPCVVTGEVSGAPIHSAVEARQPKRPGHLRAIFVGRVHRIKNLDVALRLIGRAEGSIDLTIVGPVEDSAYWTECQRVIAALPPGKTAHWVGAVSREEVGRLLGQSELMILPTRGENFSQAIIEALSAGCPVLASDQTPWRNLDALGVGWDLPLDDQVSMEKALTLVTRMGTAEHDAMRRRAAAFAQSATLDAARLHEKLFLSVLP